MKLQNVNKWKVSWVIILCYLFSLALSMEMESHKTSDNHNNNSNNHNYDHMTFTRPDIQKPVSRTIHWIFTLFFIFLMNSLSTCFAFASCLNWSLLLQIISTIYNLVDMTFLNFKDNNGIENRTSKGASIFILLTSVIILIIGFICFVKNKQNKEKIFISSSLPFLKRLNIIYCSLAFINTLAGFIKVCLAPISLFGFCKNDKTGQCLAHGIMGSSFILYGFIYSMILVIPWMKKQNTSKYYCQDYIDSWVICIYGIINTFTEHRWGKEPWHMHDYQHTAMGILWWTGGILGILLSRQGKRTFVPGLIIMFTGWSMTQHHQDLEISTNVHNMFGLILIVGGALRITEISILLRDKSFSDEILSFQYLPPFCLVCAGCLFMAANQEQLYLVLRLGAEHSAYIMIVISGAFLLYCWMLFCLEYYLYLSSNATKQSLSKYDRIDHDSSDIEYQFELSNM